MTNTRSIRLDQFLFSGSATLAQTAGLAPQEMAMWRGLASVQPIDEGCAFGIFAGTDDRFLIAHAHLHGTAAATLCVIVPRSLLAERAGDLLPLLRAVDSAAHVEPDTDGTLSPLDISDVTPPRPASVGTALTELVNAAGGDFSKVIRLLNAALHDRGVIIYGYEGDAFARVRVIEGVLALLPTRLRPDFTFSTNRHEHMTTQARLVFAERHVTSGRAVVDWSAGQFPTVEELESLATPYLRQIEAAFAEGGLERVIEHVASMDGIATTLRPDRLAISLGVLAERFSLDSLVDSDDELPVESIINVLRTAPPTGTRKFRYAERLLDYALESRDAGAAQTVSTLMDGDATLDASLASRLDAALSSHPDAVYAFVRTRLASGVEERWLTRLKAAALASLKVALLDGDTETILNWLRLIAREPAAYDLGDVLHQALLSAHVLAQQSDYPAELARGLVLLAARRDAAAIEILLNDPALLNALPDPLGAALRDHTGDPGALLQAFGLELLLVVLSRAAEQRIPDLFNSFAIEQIWTLYLNAQAAPNSPYSAESIMNQWLEHGAGWLNPPAILALLSVSLRERRDDLFHKLAHPLHDRDDYVALIAGALSRSGRGVNDSLALIAQMIAVGDLTPQSTLDMYVQLLDELEWHRAALPIMTQIGRILQQSPTLAISQAALWQLLGAAAEARDDGLMRTVVRRMDAELNATSDDTALVNSLAQLITLVGGSASARTEVIAWWRAFVRGQPTARLQKLDKLLEGRRLEDIRLIAQSAVAFRRMLGKRTLSQFAEEVNTAFGVLQSLTESYDPTGKRQTAFDPMTIRSEIEDRKEELSPQQRQIFANNLKALASMIADMGDARTKANLIRRSDDLDRQLMTGEQQPHSAVDVLKWLSGYLSGAQEEAEDEE